MVTELWKLPEPSSARVRVDFSQPGGRTCLLTCLFEPDGSDGSRVTFEGVESYRATFDTACTVEMIRAAYDRIVDLGATSWLDEVAVRLSQRSADKSGLQHLMIYFDDGPCYEFVCRSFSAGPIAAASHTP